MFIVIEVFPIENASVVCDDNGEVLTFETLEQAQDEAENCQDGRVLEV